MNHHTPHAPSSALRAPSPEGRRKPGFAPTPPSPLPLHPPRHKPPQLRKKHLEPPLQLLLPRHQYRQRGIQRSGSRQSLPDPDQRPPQHCSVGVADRQVVGFHVTADPPQRRRQQGIAPPQQSTQAERVV